MNNGSCALRWRWLAAAVALGLAAVAPAGAQDEASAKDEGFSVGSSYHNDVSPPLRDIPEIPLMLKPLHVQVEPGGLPRKAWRQYDPVVQDFLAPEAMPAPILNFDGIPFPGVACNCAPPDTNGEVGATQYVQMVNQGLQVFNKVTGASVLGPVDIETLWSGFGGVCATSGFGDPVVLYDQLANRWVVSQFAGASIPTDECVAVSTTNDATGSWNRYAFHLGSNFFDYPKLGVWPDAYYMAMNVFNASGTAFLGPQPFALDRAAMLAGTPATFITPGLQSTALGSLITGDLDGSTLPPAGAPMPWLSTELPTWKLYRFHVDWAVPANSTFTLGGNLTPAAYSTLGAGVPQLGGELLDNLADRPMFRLAYRRFPDTHEALVGNLTVSSSGVAGVRWFEINNATSGAPAFTQQGTYQPDTTWRWMASAAMDGAGNIAVGFSASSASIFPQIRYAGRLAGDPAGTLAQGEATLHSGTGSQTATSGRWGDYSDMTVDPIDDCTFWYTTEYYQTTSSFNWRTRIGNFKYDACGTPDFTLGATPASQAICAGTNAVYTINVGSISGFTNNVSLAATGNPGGTTTSFSPNPVTPPGTSTFTVGNTGAVASGLYSIAINGTASGSPGHSTPVDLTIAAAAPAAPTLVAPANSTSGHSLRPTFQWTAVADATDYTLEVDDDPAFGSIDYTATVAGTSHVPISDLAPSTLYSWRVRASNACGVGANSMVFRFATGAPGESCNSTGITINDAAPASPYPSNLTVTTAATSVATIQLKINGLTHTWPDDIDVLLVGPGGQNLVVMSDVGGSTDVTGINLILDDSAATLLPDGGPLASGTYQPSNVTAGDAFAAPAPPGPYNDPAPAGAATFTSIYGGTNPNGTWSLYVVDDAGADAGSIGGWCVAFGNADPMPFLDGFETGDTSRWSATVP